MSVNKQMNKNKQQTTNTLFPTTRKRATNNERSKKQTSASHYIHGACDPINGCNPYIEAVWQWNQWNVFYEALPLELRPQLTLLRTRITELYHQSLDNES